MECTIRPMRRDKVEVVLGFAALEGWSLGLHDAACFHATDSGGFLLAECRGQTVGCVSALAYGADFGFIGLYIVAPVWREQGIGRRLWAEAWGGSPAARSASTACRRSRTTTAVAASRWPGATSASPA